MNNTFDEESFNQLVEEMYNPKQEEVNRERIRNNIRYKNMGANLLDDNEDYTSFNEFKKQNEDFMNRINDLSLDEKIDSINKTEKRLMNNLEKELSNHGRLINTPDGFGIELDNGDIIYTDRNNNFIERELKREKREKNKEHEKNQKLLRDEYNELLKRQELEEKERERLRSEELKREKEKQRERDEIRDNITKFMGGIAGGIAINNLMGRK